MPGPLPDPKRRRRNAPTIPTTALPATGRTGRVPKVPVWVELGDAGLAWWAWAWKTPQAAGWAPGHEALVARRASLEDDLAAIAQVEGIDWEELEAAAESAGKFRLVVRRLAALVAGRLAICREMREIEDRLGLTPKGMAALRWEIVAAGPDSEPTTVGQSDDEVGRRRAERRARIVGG